MENVLTTTRSSAGTDEIGSVEQLQPFVAPAAPTFSQEEFDLRIERVREEMDRRGLKALLLVSPENIYYLTGLNFLGYFAFTLLVLPLEGEPIIVARAMEGATISAQVPHCRHAGFADYDDPAEFAAKTIASAVQPRSKIGVERSSMYFPIDVWEPMRDRLHGIDFVDGSGIVEYFRQAKSPAEIQYVRHAARASSLAIEAGIAAVGAGVSEREVAAAVYNQMVLAGSENPGFPPIIRKTDIINQDHVSWGPGIIKPGDAIFLELGASVARYHAPMSRVAYVGEAPPGTERAGEIAAAGLEAVRDALRPGSLNGDVYEAWQQAMNVGLGHSNYHRHHTGYAIGIGFPPSWVGGASVQGLRAGGTTELREGMVFHAFSWLRDQKPADYIISDTMLVTANGGEILTTTRRDPIIKDS